MFYFTPTFSVCSFSVYANHDSQNFPQLPCLHKQKLKKKITFHSKKKKKQKVSPKNRNEENKKLHPINFA